MIQLAFRFQDDPEAAVKINAISQYDHHQIMMGNYKKYPLAVGSMTHNHAEIFDFTTRQWIMIPNYPFERQYYHYSTVSVENAVYFFGGFSSKEVNTVTRFIDDEWEQIFTLQAARHGHTTVMINNEILQIGGEGEL